jgi:HK97 family phage portal protein
MATKGILKRASVSASSGMAPESGWISSILAGLSAHRTPSGVVVTEHSAMKLSAIFACVRCVSETIGALPRHIIRYEGDGKRQPVSDHPSSRLFSLEANPFTTSMTFFETLQAHAMTFGNGYAELQMEEGGARVQRAWILPPDRVRPQTIYDDNGELSLTYIVTMPDGRQVIVPRERMLHIPGLGFDGLQGYSVISFAAKAIGLGESLETFGSKYFSQGTTQPGYITVPAEMEPQAIGNLRKSLEEMNSGNNNAHRDKFLFDNVTYTPAAIKPEESQMIESRVFQIQEIARFFRIPLHKIQELSKANYNSLEQMQDEFRTDTIVPWAVRWEQEINRKFFTEPQDANLRVKFNTNALLRGDSTARSAFYRTMVSFGLMTQNEIRSLEDLSSIEGADELLVPLNMTKLSELDKEQKAATEER